MRSENELDNPGNNLSSDLFQVLAGAGAGNAMPVVDIEQRPMGRTHDVGFLKVQKFAWLEIQRAADMRTGIDVDKDSVTPPDNKKPAPAVGRFGDKSA